MGFLKGFSIAMGASFALMVLQFLNNKLVYMYLDKSDNGVYFIFMRFSMFISLFFGEWFRLSNLNLAGKDKNLIPVLSANNLWYSAAVSFFLIIATMFLSLFTDGSLFGISEKYIWIAVFVGVAVILRDSCQSILMVAGRMFRYGFTFIIWGLAALSMNVLFLVVLKRGLDFVVIAWFCGIITGAFWAYFSLVEYSGFTWKPSWKVFTQSGNIGYRAWIAVLGMFLMVNIHTFVLKPITGNTEEGLVLVAIFSVCFRFFQLLQRVSNVSGTILLSHVVQEDKETGFIRTMKVTRNIILFSIVFSMFGVTIGKPIITLISTSAYDIAYVPLLIMLPGIVAVNATSVMNGMYWGHGYPYKVILVPYFVTIIGLIIDFLCVPVMGVSGAALSFTVMSLIWFIYVVLIFHNDSGLRLRDIMITNKEDIFLVTTKIRHAVSGAYK